MASDSTRNVPWRNGFLSELKNTLVVLYIFVISNDFPVKRAIVQEFLDTKSKNAKINFQLS